MSTAADGIATRASGFGPGPRCCETLWATGNRWPIYHWRTGEARHRLFINDVGTGINGVPLADKPLAALGATPPCGRASSFGRDDCAQVKTNPEMVSEFIKPFFTNGLGGLILAVDIAKKVA